MNPIMNQDRLEVLTTSDAGRWREVLEEIGIYDFYHLPAFHRLAEIRDEGEAVMPVFREAGYVIAFPMLFRDIDLPVSTGTGFKDATSVYGYAGPLASTEYIPEETRKHFQQQFQDFLEQSSIVAVFSRLHPLIDQSGILSGYGTITQAGFTTSIDLTAPPDAQLAAYRKSHRYEIQRLRKMGFTCDEVGLEHVDDFTRIYHASMREVDADPYYYFDKPYFEYLLSEMSGVIHLFICRDVEVVACVGLFGTCNGIIQYHLAGTAAEYRRLAPMKLMLDTVRERANEMGGREFHLGGGVGARRDSLYEFKLGFGGREHGFAVWQHIAASQVYDNLCQEMRRYAGAEPDTPYFPMYRHPMFQADRAIGLRRRSVC